MNIYKKISFILTTILILFFLTINGITGFEIGDFEQNIFNPLNITIGSESNSINDGTALESPYSKFENYKIPLESENNCKVGGQYQLQVLSWPPEGAGLFNRTVNLFYCKTTQDLINEIKIPTSWENNDLILYCNDGKEIYSQINNFDFLTSNLNTYKACILKNLDKENTVLYGYEVGNSIVDSDGSFFFNKTTNLSRIITDSNFDFVSGNLDGNYTFKDKTDNKNYTFRYNNVSKFYSLSDTSETFNLNINEIFTRDIGISRIVLHRQINNEQIYGYESAIESTRNPSIITPIYKIFYEGAITLSAGQCTNSLKKYGATSGTLGANDKILCKEDLIEIYSNKLDTKYGDSSVDSGGTVISFNIFKNIILSLNG